MRILQKASRFLFKALEWFAIICMVVLTVIVFTDVILRYIFKQGFPWTQEVATLMLVWFSLIGMAIGVLERIHISIEMFTSKLPAKVIRVLESIDPYSDCCIRRGYGVLWSAHYEHDQNVHPAGYENAQLRTLCDSAPVRSSGAAECYFGCGGPG